MKALVVQIQPDRVPSLDVDGVRGRLEEFGSVSPHVLSQRTETGQDSGRFINVTFSTKDMRLLWGELKARFFVEKGLLADAVIVTCEGSSGWEDYLLLHHYDRKEKLDSV